MKIKSIKKVTLSDEKQYYDVVNAYPYNNFLVKTNSGYVCSHNCFFDEISFLKNQDVEKQKLKAKDMINTAKGGMKTRFIYKGKNPTLLVVASSKKSEQAFMESYIRELRENEGDNVKIVDKPVWEVKPKGTYKNEVFYVGLGNRFLDNIVIPRSDYDKLDLYVKKGYELLAVPTDFEADAKGNLERVLCDYAGISSFSSNKFLSAERVSDVVDEDSLNPLPAIITCGDAKDDLAQYSDWFDWSKLDRKYMNRPLFIHLDMSKTKDKTGIAGVWIIGKKPTSDGNPGKDLMFKVAFSTSIKAPTGRQISFEKNRNFIRWCKAKGFKVKKITCDTYQSADLQQILTGEGYDCDILSVDRVDNVQGGAGICKPYEYIRNVMYEHRIILNKVELNTNELLYNEFVQLEKNNNTGKVDHPDGFSKDQADAVTGATYTASSFADEYAHDYGEDAELVLKINNKSSSQEAMQDELTKQLIEMRPFLNPRYANIDEGLTEEDKQKAQDAIAFNHDIIFPM